MMARARLLPLTLLLATLACNLPAYTRLAGGTPTPQGMPVPQATAPATTNDTTQQLAIFETAWTAIRDQYVREDFGGADWDAVGETYRARINAGLTTEQFEQLLRDLTAELPEAQVRYETRAERLEADSASTSQYQGIGAFIAFREKPEPHVVILAVIKGSPAELAGVKAHDSLYAIDGEPVHADEAATVAFRIRGPANSSVKLTLQSPGGSKRDLTIQRGQITATDTLKGGEITDAGVAYYRIPVVGGLDMANLIAQSLQEINADGGLKGLILDLRVAHGASWPLGDMLTLFGDGDLGEFYTRAGTEAVQVQGQDLAGSQNIPLVILVGPDTQGPPEIFAAALQASGRATIVGLPTSGLVEGSDEIPLPDGSRLFLATSSYRTSKGDDIGLEGVQPDAKINSDWDQVTTDRDAVLAAAVALLTK